MKKYSKFRFKNNFFLRAFHLYSPHKILIQSLTNVQSEKLLLIFNTKSDGQTKVLLCCSTSQAASSTHFKIFLGKLLLFWLFAISFLTYAAIFSDLDFDSKISSGLIKIVSLN